MQSQIVCGGCRHFLSYPRGASSVRCSVCSTINPIAPAMETAQLVCVGCRTLLVYPHGAASVRCACCHTSNDARPVLLARVNCSRCHTTLEYPSGAASVKCAVCQCITNIGMTSTMIIPIPTFRPNGTIPSSSIPPTSAPTPIPRTQTVVVENPMTMDESGNLVGNVVVGVTTGKK